MRERPSADRPIHCIMLGLGGPTFIADWARAVARFASLHGVTVVRRLPAGVEPVPPGCGLGEVDGFRVLYVRALRLRPSRIFWRVNARIEAAAIMRATSLLGGPRPGILHSHFYAGSAGASMAAPRLGVPLVVTEHTSNLASRNPRSHVSRQGLALMKGVFERAALVMFVGRDQLEAARNLGLGGHFAVVPNPVDSDLFTPSPKKDRTPRLVSIGHLIPRKRHGLLIEAFALVRVLRPEATLDIVGAGRDRDALEREAARIGVADGVTFHGSVPRATVAGLLSGSSVYVHTAEWESFGVAIVEALMAGLPVVTTRCGGVTADLPDRVGIVVDDPTPEAVAQAIGAALDGAVSSDPASIAKWAVDKYGVASVSNSIEQHYRKVLGDPATPVE